MGSAGSGTWRRNTSRERWRLSASTMLVSTYGNWRRNSGRPTSASVSGGQRSGRSASIAVGSNPWSEVWAPCLRPGPEPAQLLRCEGDYFARNAERMRYPAFRRQHLFVGSGVIEAGCKTLIGARLKCSGMFWTVRGANAIIALRCNRLSNRFEDYWEARHARAA